MDILIASPIGLLIGGAVLLLAVLFSLELFIIRRINTLASPAIEYARTQADKEAAHILEAARESARSLVAQAESAATQVTAARAREDEAARKAHEAALREIRERFEASFTGVTRTMQAAAEGAHTTLSDELKTLGEAARGEFAKAVETSTTAFSKELTHSLEKAREEVAQYERARNAAVDAHIRELVAETTKLTLAESLPEAAHAKLIVKALEEARAMHVI